MPAAQLPAMLGSRAFSGGLLDTGAMHLHPLNFALGLARACDAAGVRIYEHSAALDYTLASPASVRTEQGEVTARYVVLGCDGYLGELEPRIAARIMPINNFVIATAPLGAERARSLIRDDVCVHDTRFVVNYFRLSADGRLLFGGGENYRGGFPAGHRRVRPAVHAERVSAARRCRDRLRLGRHARHQPHPPAARRAGCRRMCSLRRVSRATASPSATLAGKLIAEAVAGTAERFDVLARLPAPALPGGTLLRWPLLVLGMLYYALRDRL